MVRALLRGERAAGPLMMGALVGMFAVAVGGLILALGYRSQFIDLKHVIYSRCQAREAYDQASQEARVAQRQWFTEQITAEEGNRFIDANLRAQRIASAQRAIDGLDRALTVGAPRGCAAYK